MNVSKLLLTIVIALSLGLVACSSDDDLSSSGGEDKNNTNVSVTLRLSQNSSMNATKFLPDEYNKVGAWVGKDSIESVTIYLVDGVSVTSQTFMVGKDYVRGLSSDQVVLNPLKTAAMKTTAGTKKVYVIINATDQVKDALNKPLVPEFEKAYNEVALVLDNLGTSTKVKTSADTLAVKYDKISEIREKIVMTNVSPVTIDVEPNVTAEQATTNASPKNRVSISVERAVARVMVSTESSTYDVKVGASTLGTISEISWVLAQGEKLLYIQRKADWVTPNYAWFPKVSADYYDTTVNGPASRYDYSGLFEDYATTGKLGGTPVATMSDYATSPSDAINKELNDKLSGKFILPSTHKYAEGAKSEYKKGNTAYVLIRARFTPSKEVFGDNEVYTKGNDFYVGANGKFYTSAENAVDPYKGGVKDQKVAKYEKGKVLYYAWVNPDVVPAWYNSPVLRNNIYHIHITGFKNLGTNWNPLFPENPDSDLPQNPDPKPRVTGIKEPVNPIDPTDPLTTPETWMSVDVKVLPWTLHSYNVDLGI